MRLKNTLQQICLAILLLSNSVYAQQQYRFKRISINRNLAQKKVYCITQDKKGFIWFGTEAGLSKYDGYKFSHYKNILGDSTTLSNNYILSIYQDSQGIIWVGTYGGLNKFNPENETFINHLHHPHNPKSISNNYIWSIIEDHEGNIWLGTYGGLNKYDKKTNEFKAYKHEPNNPKSISNDYVWSIYEDHLGNIWVGTYNGLNKFNKKEQSFTRYFNNFGDTNSISHNDIRAIYQDKFNNLWIGTYGGLNKFNYEADAFSRYIHDPSNPNSLSDNSVRTITADNNGDIWIGTSNGLNKLSNQSKFIHFRNEEKNNNSISSNDILSLFEDKFGSLWIGTPKEINKFDPNNDKFTLINQHNSDNSISSNNIWAIYEDSNKNVWIGTDNGLNKINGKTKEVEHYSSNPYSSNSSLSFDHILCISEDHKSNLWIGTYGGGLNKFNTSTKKNELFINNPLDTNSISNDKISRLLIDKDSTIWVATYDGLNKYIKKTNSFIRFKNNPKNPNSLSNNYILSICEDEDNNLWIGTDEGLNRYNKKNRKFNSFKNNIQDTNTISNNTIWSICYDNRGYLWIGTHGGGLNAFSFAKNRFMHWTTDDGLPSNIVYGVLKDKHGNIWMSTKKGICKLMPTIKNQKIAEVGITNYDETDGIQGLEFNGGAYFKNTDGKMFFGGTNGLNVFYPENVKDNSIPPEVAITSLKIFNKAVEVNSNLKNKNNKVKKTKEGYFLPKHISYTNEVTLSYKDNVIQIDFAALHFSLPESNAYAYKLENFEESWNYTTNKRFANYTNLDPGKYVFRVIAANCDGAWNNKGASLVINISPPFYSTWTFRIIIVLSLLLGVIVFIRYREKKIRTQKRILEETVAKRTYEIIQQKEEIEEQKDEIQTQRDEIRKKNKNITDSIKYALKIQQAILPPDRLVSKLFSNTFIFYKPKDIVSGDFYWLREKDGKVIIAAVDCTGHGVPGAFMSIVANNLLNQAVSEQNLSSPSKILDFVNKGINETFTYNDKSNVKDGMDIALCAIKNRTLEYAGAYNPLYLIRDNALMQFKADSRSIEVSHIALDKEFTNNTIPLQAEDIIYIFTDGFVDQFGGPNRKKFLKKRLRETFLQINQLPLREQKEKLTKVFVEWQGNNEQTDDVLIIGIKV